MIILSESKDLVFNSRDPNVFSILGTRMYFSRGVEFEIT